MVHPEILSDELMQGPYQEEPARFVAWVLERYGEDVAREVEKLLRLQCECGDSSFAPFLLLDKALNEVRRDSYDALAALDDLPFDAGVEGNLVAAHQEAGA